MSAISGTNIGNSEGLFCQTTAVDRDDFTVGELPRTKKGIHEKLIVHSLKVKVWGDSACREQST